MAVVAPKPSEFKSVIVDSTDTLPIAFVKVFIRFPVLLYRWFLSVYGFDSKFTPEFKAKICAACPDTDTEETA